MSIFENKKDSLATFSNDELVAAAEYYGEDASLQRKELVEALKEAGVTAEMAFNDLAPKTVEEPVETPANVIVSEHLNANNSDAPVEVVTKAPETFANNNKYLIRFTGENPYFEWGSYKFTQENPYCIMSANDAEAILREDGRFRQAFPSELNEFYG